MALMGFHCSSESGRRSLFITKRLARRSIHTVIHCVTNLIGEGAVELVPVSKSTRSGLVRGFVGKMRGVVSSGIPRDDTGI